MKETIIIEKLIDLSKITNNLKDIINLNKKKVIILIDSEMGSGKTTLTRYLINSYYNKNIIVTSPTFGFVNIYKINNDRFISHYDLYNIKKLKDFTNLEIDCHIRESEISIIEWPKIVKKYIKNEFKDFLIIELKIKNPNEEINPEKRIFSIAY